MSVAIAILLGALALQHVYWAVAGVGGGSVAIPEVAGRPAFTPSRVATFGVAAALGVAVALVLARGGHLSLPVPPRLVQAGTTVVGILFVLRAVGDFRLIGFFKRVRGSRFARWDTCLFSPLSLAIGLGTLRLSLS